MTRTSIETLRQEKLWRKASADPVLFCESWVKIQHPSEGRIPFILTDAQKEGLAHWRGNRFSLTLKARQIGWSTLVAAYVLWLVFTRPDLNILLLSRTERESVKLLSKVKLAYRSLPQWVRDRGPKLKDDHSQRMTFSNDSVITSLPSSSDPARGESASLVVVDEWAFLLNPEEAWASIEPVADVGGSIIGLSTANGMGNFFFTLWDEAVKGINDFEVMFHPWWAAKNRQHEDGTPDWVWFENKKRSLPGWQLAQEYPTTAEEAFVKSGNPVFDSGLLVELQKHAITPDRFVFSPLNTVTDFNVIESEGGELRVWEKPRLGQSIYVIGADVSEGLAHGDFSSAHVIDVGSGRVVAHWHGHVHPDLFGEQLYMLGSWYGGALLGVEVNNHGLTTVTSLRKLSYPNLWRRREENRVTHTLSVEYGWRTTVNTKPLLIDSLVQSVRDQDIDVRCVDTVGELVSYVRDDKGRTHGSPFDDRVISLALANYMRRFAHQVEYQSSRDTAGTFEFWLERFEEQGRRSGSEWVIGGRSGRVDSFG